MGKIAAKITAWIIGGAAMLHTAYVFFPPEYYIQAHGGDASAARWVSVFAVPIFVFFLLLPEMIAPTDEKNEDAG
jgi:hypothetical protein